jgi:hypothetical protein
LLKQGKLQTPLFSFGDSIWRLSRMQDEQDDDDLEMVDYDDEHEGMHDPGHLSEQLQAVENEIAQVGRGLVWPYAVHALQQLQNGASLIAGGEVHLLPVSPPAGAQGKT